MSIDEQSTPAFGQADLTNCEREQIQFAGSIQPHGALLVVDEPDHNIVQISSNAAEFLGLSGDLVGRGLADICSDLYEKIQPNLHERMRDTPVVVRCRMGDPSSEYDCLLHRPDDGGLIVEFERAGPAFDLQDNLRDAVQTIIQSASLPALCDDAAKLFKKFTGYDRVMVYRFDENGHGEVFSEQREQHLEAYLGNRYPSTDIPQIARRLYERNRVRVLVEVDYKPISLVPRLSPITGQDLDMSMCFLRSMSPIHLQYLKNMGVRATLVASLMVGGKLWGLISCHHYDRKFIHYELRAVCELLAETIATRIAALESFAQANAELGIGRLERRLAEAVSRDGDWKTALFENPQSLLEPTSATGAALMFEGRILTSGEVPSTRDLDRIRQWLDEKSRAPVIATASLGLDHPEFKHLTEVASGVLAAPISSSKGDYLVWFRRERVQELTWGRQSLQTDDPR